MPAHITPRPNRDLLETIPEAHLLQPAIMLKLSKSLFMNRSPTIPSPWPHWSEYTSELAEEPAIYRSAFNDFHTLAISVTKRLAQTALIQATSRLRSQRQRYRKGVLPLVKRRDVLSAIDILGMKRNGKERWRGVARRCSVRVYDQDGKQKKEVSWDDVERAMRSTEASTEPLTTDAETSGNDTETFNYRAARSGTPLPMEQLAISDSDEDVDLDDEFNDSMSESEGSLLDENQTPISRCITQPRDPSGRYTSAPPATTSREGHRDLHTLEQFDQEASRQEEQTLWEMLELEAPIKQDETKNDEHDDEEGLADSGNIITDPDGWRNWTEFHAEWEEFRKAVPAAKFDVPDNPDKPASAAQVKSSKARASGVDTDTSTRGNSRRHKRQTSGGIELQARSTRAYAALQEKASEPNHQHRSSDDGWLEDSDSDASADVPTQSIEDPAQVVGFAAPDDEMDWA
ncbi:Nn.00g029010.m01.CDS01 [Neocucurbitaria sp. VM-36]